jgi:hypothetical protein
MNQTQNPFEPALHGGVQFRHDEPITGFDPGAAKVRFRIKGSSATGVTYQGQQVYQPCIGCGTGRAAPFVPRKPRKFIRYEATDERAIVIPWLSSAAVWDELKYCLRAIHRFFEDRECPIRIIGDAAPKWLRPGGRVEFIYIPEYKFGREAGLYQAFLRGMQGAEITGWWNDDIYLLRPTGWDDMRVALTEGELTGMEDRLRASNVPWQRALGEAVEELKLRGHSQVLRFATHTPYLFELEKAREIFREFYLHHKGSWVTLYHNYHATPHTPCKPFKVEKLPTTRSTARYLNHRHAGPDMRTKRELEQLFPDPAPWEI